MKGPRRMPSVASAITINAFRVRNFAFFAAILLLNYTLSRPSPVDMVVVFVAVTCLFINQRVSANFLILSFVLIVWTLSVYISSLDFLGNSVVRFELLAKTFVVGLGLVSCYVASSWRDTDFEVFIRVYIWSCLFAACLGIFGFVAGIEDLMWDGRAKGFIDDPNMYGSFLVPGILCCLYLISQHKGRALASMALPILTLGLILSFSRAAMGALAVCSVAYLAFINRRNLVKAGAIFLLTLALTITLGTLALFLFENFQEKILDRFTLAKDYDLGYGGRYSRYLLSLPIILDNPLGIGLEQIERYFPENIHNIFVSSFLNYGWLGGLAWLLLTMLSVSVALSNYRQTASPISALLFFGYLSQVLGASLHEGEHWRHLWLFLGLLWGFNVHNFAVARQVPSPEPQARPLELGFAGQGALPR